MNNHLKSLDEYDDGSTLPLSLYSSLVGTVPGYAIGSNFGVPVTASLIGILVVALELVAPYLITQKRVSRSIDNLLVSGCQLRMLHLNPDSALTDLSSQQVTLLVKLVNTEPEGEAQLTAYQCDLRFRHYSYSWEINLNSVAGQTLLEIANANQLSGEQFAALIERQSLVNIFTSRFMEQNIHRMAIGAAIGIMLSIILAPTLSLLSIPFMNGFMAFGILMLMGMMLGGITSSLVTKMPQSQASDRENIVKRAAKQLFFSTHSSPTEGLHQTHLSLNQDAEVADEHSLLLPKG